MRNRSVYESYLRIQLEAIVISMLAILLTIGCVLWAYRSYWEKTRVSYLHNHGVTVQIMDESETRQSRTAQ